MNLAVWAASHILDADAGVAVERSSEDALITNDIRRMIQALPDSLIGQRDACLLLLGFAAALRRSELVGLDVEAVEQTPMA